MGVCSVEDDVGTRDPSLRNPHLAWMAGYYEAHLRVSDSLDFYRDLWIGGPFAVIGGFNCDLGWATTNNDPLLWQVYAVTADSASPDRYWLDGESRRFDRISTTIDYKTPTGMTHEARESLRTTLGPVIGRDGNTVYVLHGPWMR